MARLCISLLGSFQVTLDGKPVSFSYDKVRALLAYLAVESDRSHRRETLAGMLWHEHPERDARQSLSQALLRLRGGIGDYDAAFLQITPQTLQFDCSSDCWLDVTAFTELLDAYAGEVWDEEGRPSQAEPLPQYIDLHRQAVALYRGRFLAGFSLGDSPAFEEWCLLQQERYRRMVAEALRRLARGYRRSGNYDEALHHARRWRALDSWHEGAYRELMLSLALSGQRNAALIQYETCRRILAQELGVEPELETTALYQRIRNGEVGQETRSVESWQVTPHNLPAQLTPFVDRKKELSTIQECLQDSGCRLLTLVGPGGSGKTRLALEAAVTLLSTDASLDKGAEGFYDGVFFVSLAALQSAEGIVPAVARALGFSFYRDTEPQLQLLDYLRQKRILLILDGFEHLAGSVDLVIDILETAPQVKLLITSRAALNVDGEHLLSIAGMAYPEQTQATAEELQAYAAVELFMHAARRVKGRFDPTLDELRHVSQICFMVQGMPLAILLAASWSRMLSPGEIANQIGQGIDFLETDWRGLPQRQRSMRAVFDRSWSLLNEKGQLVLRELSAFRGGFTWEAVQQVVGASLSDLLALVDQSLLHRALSGRYGMHELLRQYVAEKLNQTQDAGATTHDRHCAYYTTAVQKWAADMKGLRYQGALEEMTLELENVQAAWNWAAQEGRVVWLDRAIEGLCLFYERSGRYQNGRVACQIAAERLETVNSGDGLRVRAKMLAWQSAFSEKQDHLELARQSARQSLLILDDPSLARCETRPERAFALSQMAKVAVHSDVKEAVQLGEQSLVLYRALNDRWMTANVLDDLSSGAFFLSAHDRAQQFCKESLTIRRALGDERGIASSLESLGVNLLHQGEVEEAERLVRESIQLRREMNDQVGLAGGLFHLGSTLVWLGRHTEARSLLEEAVTLYEDLGNRVGASKSYALLGAANGLLGLYQQAHTLTHTALSLAQDVSSWRDIGIASWTLGCVALARESYAQAQEWLQEGVAVLRETGVQDMLSTVLACLGYAVRGLGQQIQAEQYLAEALQMAVRLRTYGAAMFVLVGIALLLCDQGEVERAVELYALASRRPLVARSHWFEDVAGKHIAATAANLSPGVAEAARQRGWARDLGATLVELLAGLEEDLST